MAEGRYETALNREGITALLKAADLKPSDRILDLGWNGASMLPEIDRSIADRWFYTTDLRRARACADACPGARVLASASLVEAAPQRYDVMLYHPAAHSGKARVFQLFEEGFSLLEQEGRLVLSGHRDRGIESLARHAEKIFSGGECLSRKGRRRVYRFHRHTDRSGADEVASESAFTIDDAPGATPEAPLAFETGAGLFSWDNLDPGSRFLLESVEIRPNDRVLDVGCGYGAVGISAARRAGEGEVVLVDVDVRAVSFARRNILLNNLVNASAADGDLYEAAGEAPFDLILSNPPFHEGRSTSDPLIDGAARRLRPDGRLAIVIMRPQSYRKRLRRAFAEVDEIAGANGYTVLTAKRPELA